LVRIDAPYDPILLKLCFVIGDVGRPLSARQALGCWTLLPVGAVRADDTA